MISVSNEMLNCQTVTDAIIAEGNEGMAYQADCTNGEEVQGLVDAVMAKCVQCPHVAAADRCRSAHYPHRQPTMPILLRSALCI